MKRKHPVLSKEEFFGEISKLSNYCDQALVESMYYGMIKVISRQLKAGKRVKMPDWGEFYVHDAAPRMAMDVRSRQMRSISMKKYVKFEPDYKVKAYFNGLA